MIKRKTILSAFLAAILTVALCVPQQMAFAEEGNIDAGALVSREEVAESISASKGITYDEALQYIIDSEEKLAAEKGYVKMPRAASISYRYYTAVKKTISGVFELEAWAYVQIWNEGSFRQFEEILNTGSGAIGISNASWDPTVTAKLTTPTRLDLSCRGYLSTKTTFEVSGAYESSLLGQGFTVSGSVGTEMSISGSVTFSQRWDLY